MITPNNDNVALQFNIYYEDNATCGIASLDATMHAPEFVTAWQNLSPHECYVGRQGHMLLASNLQKSIFKIQVAGSTC